ncbi:2-hydroxy-acid oxidase [Streptomyces sp. SID3343]|uniref:2-hydroxy-acid oxidase n=1 Tax=Streptomyces sp. SID3343 TaxID=2690260 RepID=UPI001370A1B8|nr:2-hydroxy-acid oxidase [Streptomyces sp. SID3343]MYW00792.1 2-hydroxy-acid oxidase [Streptomyces sp. SID3343]
MPATRARGLRVTRAIAAGFDGRSEASLHPDLRTFVGDLVRPYGLPLREDLLSEGAGHDYGQMAEGLLGKVLPADEPADLLILAFSSPDVRPGAPAALQLSRHCPGQPTAFAVCDQGSAAAFTALRIAAAHHRTGGCRRAVIVLAEQSALHYEAPEPVELPEEHRAVVLVCEEGAGEGMRVHQQAQADGAQALRSVLADHRELGRGAGLLLAADLAGAASPADLDSHATPEAVETARPGQPFTGVWTLLADRLAQRPQAGGPLLVADHDRRLGRLSTLSLP